MKFSPRFLLKLSVPLIFLLLLFTVPSKATCTLAAPSGLKSQTIASCQVTVKWKHLNGAVNYNLQYKVSTAMNWTVVNNIGNVTSYTISGLVASTSYNIKVSGVCVNNEDGAYSAPITVTTVTCSAPVNVSVSGISATSANVAWAAPCGETKFKVNYRKTGTTTWTVIANITAFSYNITGLQAATSYQLKVKSQCGNQPSTFSQLITFTTQPLSTAVTGKNVLLIIVDDSRFDSYSPTGGPDWFADSNIARIANEGVNFQSSFVTQSQCAPSRGSITTGVYPHIHGVTDNPPLNMPDTITLITLPQILQSHGYYTGLVGKYHISKNPQPGYNYWMEVHNNDYTDTKYDVNGKTKLITGHQTDVVTDSAIGFLHKVPQGKPFFLWFAYKAPHTPLDPRPVDVGVFDNDTMPFPSNFQQYTENYPAFLYNCHSSYDSAGVIDYYRGYFELLQGVEVTLGKVLDELKTMGVMDSTLIIFMSDNGYMIGEHDMNEKQLAYDESMRIPIFMRYPGLIPAGKQIKKQIATNIDIAPTILDFAGIPDTFGMQGISLLKLMNSEVMRKEMMYEFYDQSCVPDIRAVRSLEYKYVQYNCSSITEEFFDLTNDPHENTNQVNNPAYATLVQDYRDKLTFWRNFYQDFTWDSMYECSLSNPQRLEHEANAPLVLLNIFPSPANVSVNIHFISSETAPGSLRIVNAIGHILYTEDVTDALTEFSETVPVKGWLPGNYFAIIRHGTHTYERSFEVQ